MKSCIKISLKICFRTGRCWKFLSCFAIKDNNTVLPGFFNFYGLENLESTRVDLLLSPYHYPCYHRSVKENQHLCLSVVSSYCTIYESHHISQIHWIRKYHRGSKSLPLVVIYLEMGNGQRKEGFWLRPQHAIGDSSGMWATIISQQNQMHISSSYINHHLRCCDTFFPSPPLYQLWSLPKKSVLQVIIFRNLEKYAALPQCFPHSPISVLLQRTK